MRQDRRDVERTFDPSQDGARSSRRSAWSRLAPYLLVFLLGAGIAFLSTFLINRILPLQQPSVGSSPLLTPVPGNLVTATQLPANPGANLAVNVVEQVGPAVVRIDSSRTVTNPVPQAFNDPLFREFFGLEGPVPPEKQIVRGVGSGFIINADGQILTNAHVVAGADTVTVTLKDGRTFQGKVLGQDPVTDIAVVKIPSQNLPTVTLGTADPLKPGEWVIAIGNPIGLDNTVTSGILSGTGRSLSDSRVDFLQTDAAINPGNSGGPLLNAQGRVIGVNTAMIQGAQGISFAIPINTAKRIADQLITSGKVEHSYLGVEMVTLTPEVKRIINSSPNSNLQVQADQGVLIAQVLPNSPAASAGLQPGDIVQRVKGQAVTEAREVQQLVDSSPVGSTLPIELRRQGQTLTLNVQTEALPVPKGRPNPGQ
ncbi:MAG: HhoA/HhoB/HtrA family serine endopeptidase [Leptolyngbyaceae bacterium]|nr:HhoA/HhoB/HtrA family serine endopeptidase [Leptolyngbyaceae bacterium]